jgi:hypothetical protein
MEQQRAINALEPFLALSKSANSPRAAADLVTKATSAPNTYVFAELLHTPNISALQDSAEFSSYYKLLEIFAWGTWADYQCTLCDLHIRRDTDSFQQSQIFRNSLLSNIRNFYFSHYCRSQSSSQISPTRLYSRRCRYLTNHLSNH